jgi:hypothetical protein
MSKLIQRLIRRPTADNTANQYMTQVLGNKADAAAAGLVTETDTIVAYLKQLVGNNPEWLAGTVDTSPLASMSLWTVSGGPVMIHEIFGVVATVIQTQATTIGLLLDPTDAGSNVALSGTSTDGSALPTGHLLRWSKDFSEDVLTLLDAVEATDVQAPGVIVMPGDIEVVYGATSTGVINWFALYSRIGAGIMAAA